VALEEQTRDSLGQQAWVPFDATPAAQRQLLCNVIHDMALAIMHLQTEKPVATPEA
jgi:hypothetical protein